MKQKVMPFVVFALFLFCNISPAQPFTLKLWPGGIPGSLVSPEYKEVSTVEDGIITRWDRVTDPSVTVCLPPEGKATGTAVLICPGGGYGTLAFNHVGNDIAGWLNNNGIAGIILKYRLPSDQIMKDKSTGPLQDAQEAIRIIRRNARAWNIDTARIGVIGFSAGGHLASTLSTHFDEKVYESKDNISARPDFSVLIYPVITMDESFTHLGSRRNLLGENPSGETLRHFSNEMQIRENTPPAFLVHSSDDAVVPVRNSMAYYKALVKFNIPSELHIFQEGGHGYGLAVSTETQSAWPRLCLDWLRASGF